MAALQLAPAAACHFVQNSCQAPDVLPCSSISLGASNVSFMSTSVSKKASSGKFSGSRPQDGAVKCQVAASEPVVAEHVQSDSGDWSRLSRVCAVLGSQWGDEGKGKLVDILAQRYDVVARCQVCPSCMILK